MRTYELPQQNQHYVPKGYLKQFTKDGSGFFQQLSKRTKKIRQEHINNVCCLPNFYDLHDIDYNGFSGLPIRFLEASFSRYEYHLPRIIEKIRDKISYLSPSDVDILINAYTDIKHRTPYTRNVLGRTSKEGNISSNVILDFARDNQALLQLFSLHGFNYDDFSKTFLQKTLNDVDAARKTHLFGLVTSALNDNEAVADAKLKMLSMDFIIAEAPSNSYYVVSDNPGYHADGRTTYNLKFGSFTQIFFPINSRQLILFTNFDRRNVVSPLRRLEYVKVNHEFVDSVNRNTVLFSDKKIFCEDRLYLERVKHLI